MHYYCDRAKDQSVHLCPPHNERIIHHIQSESTKRITMDMDAVRCVKGSPLLALRLPRGAHKCIRMEMRSAVLTFDGFSSAPRRQRDIYMYATGSDPLISSS
jgi:hypothetical protein